MIDLWKCGSFEWSFEGFYWWQFALNRFLCNDYLFLSIEKLFKKQYMEDPYEKDQFYGCDCQRYLAVGLLMPVLVLLSVFGGAAMLILLPGRGMFFCMETFYLWVICCRN